jgi:hypothetical protein
MKDKTKTVTTKEFFKSMSIEQLEEAIRLMTILVDIKRKIAAFDEVFTRGGNKF